MNPYAPSSPHYAVAQRILEAGRWLTYRDLGVSPEVALGYKMGHCERCGRRAKAMLCWRCQGVRSGP